MVSASSGVLFRDAESSRDSVLRPFNYGVFSPVS